MACVGCEIKEEATLVDVQQLIQEQLELELETNLTTAEELAKRLIKCEGCPFRSGHTCTKCGCYYQFRANLKYKTCPEKKW